MGGRSRLHVTNLLPEVEDSDLKKHFEAFGEVNEAWVDRERDTKFPKGCGYVRMSNSSQLTRILECDHEIFDTKVLVATEASDVPESGAGRRESSREEPGRFYVTNLLPDMSEGDIKECFSKYGAVADVQFSKDRDGRPKGSGFVKMVDPEAVEQILSLDAKHEVNGHEVTAKNQSSGNERSGRTSRREDHGRDDSASGKYYVGGLTQDHTEDHLRTYFGGFGEVSSVELVMKDGSHRGYAFVKFATASADLEKALMESEHKIDGQKVDVKHGKPRDSSSRGGHGHGTSPAYPSSTGAYGGYGHAPPQGAYPTGGGYPASGGYGGYPPPGYAAFPPPPSYGSEKGGYGGGAGGGYGRDGGSDKGGVGGSDRGSYGDDRSRGGSDRPGYGSSDKGYGGGSDRGSYGTDRGGSRGHESRSSPYGSTRDDRNGDSSRSDRGAYGSRSQGYGR